MHGISPPMISLLYATFFFTILYLYANLYLHTIFTPLRYFFHFYVVLYLYAILHLCTITLFYTFMLFSYLLYWFYCTSNLAKGGNFFYGFFFLQTTTGSCKVCLQFLLFFFSKRILLQQGCHRVGDWEFRHAKRASKIPLKIRRESLASRQVWQRCPSSSTFIIHPLVSGQNCQRRKKNSYKKRSFYFFQREMRKKGCCICSPNFAFFLR